MRVREDAGEGLRKRVDEGEGEGEGKDVEGRDAGCARGLRLCTAGMSDREAASVRWAGAASAGAVRSARVPAARPQAAAGRPRGRCGGPELREGGRGRERERERERGPTGEQ